MTGEIVIKGIPPDKDQFVLTNCGWQNCGITSNDEPLNVVAFKGILTTLCDHHKHTAGHPKEHGMNLKFKIVIYQDEIHSHPSESPHHSNA